MLQILQLSQGESGTTLSQTITSAAFWNRTFNWTISKVANLPILNLFRGDTGAVQYTITVTNSAFINSVFIQGEVCITNGGAIATEGLASLLEVRSPVNGAIIATANLNVSAQPVLAPGQTYCYPYSINITSGFVPGQSYKVTANTTILNHSGSIGTPFGPSTSVSGNFPAAPRFINASITVTDSNLPGQSPFTFTAISGGGSQSTSYTQVYTCNNEGQVTNTARIDQTGQTASATVIIKCFNLIVSKTVNTSFTRTYKWTITKVAVDPTTGAQISSLNLSVGQQYTVRYIITVTPVITDSNFIVSGIITVTNPNPDKSATILVSDFIATSSENTNAVVTPETAVLLPNETRTFNYTSTFSTQVTGNNQATALLQNNTGLTTAFLSMPVPFDFSNAFINEIDPCINVEDSFNGMLSTSPVCRQSMTFTYDRIIGPYTSCNSFVEPIKNTSTFMNSTAFGTASWSISVTVPCSGCTLTIGYWKTHAGFGPGNQPNVVGPILARGYINLGTPGGPKTAYVTTEAQVVAILNFMGWDSTIPGPTSTATASNGINRLYAQLLAAKLNIAGGAYPAPISSVITAADNFLATHDTNSWATLSRAERNQVNTWQSQLESYNSGLVGPGHCSEQFDVSSAMIVPLGVLTEISDSSEV